MKAWPRRRLITLLGLAIVSAVAAWAYWSGLGDGTAAAPSATLRPATLGVPGERTNSIPVSWTQQASLLPASEDNNAITYSVERRLDDGPYSTVTTGGCSGSLPYGTASCQDTPPDDGSYSYRAVASFRTWTAISNVAGPVAFTDVVAPTTVAVLTPEPNAAGWNNASPVTVALNAEDVGGSGVAEIKYTTDGSDPTSSPTAQVYGAPFAVAVTATVKYFATDGAGNASAVESRLVKIDAVAPANAVTLSGVAGGAFKSGAVVYYRGSVAGSFTLTNAVTDGASGPAASATAALSGGSAGWTHSPSSVSTPAGGPYVSSGFSWAALTSSAPGEIVTGSDAAGNTTGTPLTFSDDSVPPSGGSVDATGLGGTGGRYSTSTSLSLAFSAGTDSASGLATTGARLLRASARLGDGTCGAYGAYAQVGANDPTSPIANTVPVDHTCYRYRYEVVDRVGNVASYTSPDIKVDTAAAHPDFLQPVTSPEPAGVGASSMAVGDIDNDGDQDIVTATYFDSSLKVLVNDGVGSFRAIPLQTFGATTDAGLGHFDGDSNLDLALIYLGTPENTALGSVVIFKGGGDGTFAFLSGTNASVKTGIRPTSLVVGNFDGNAIDDVAVVNSRPNPDWDIGSVYTYLGNPAGTDTFSAATPAQMVNAQTGATDVVHADFNGGAKDLVISNYGSSSITLLGGNGTGFNAATHISTGVPIKFLAAAQLNAGTSLDIVGSIRGDGSPSAIRTLFGNGAGAFTAQTTTVANAAGAADSPQQIVAQDFDNDGDADAAMANGVGTVSVLANSGSGVFAIAPASPETGVGSPTKLTYGLASADFDGNGYSDLAATSLYANPGELRTLLNQNGGRADLSIVQTDTPDPVAVGQTLTYTLSVANAGPGTPSSVKATDDLPTGVTFNSSASSPGCSAAGTTPVTVTCDYGSVAPGSPESQQVVVNTSAGTPASLTNTATVGANLADASPADNASTTSTATYSDTAPPADGTVSYSDGYRSSLAVSVSFTPGTDSGSGLNAASGLLQRAEAPLTSGGACDTYLAFATVTGGTNPASPFNDTGLVSGKCYQYRYLISDNVGNQATYTSASVVKVDATAPTVTRAVVAKTDGSTPGTIRQGGAYFVYAEAGDAVSLATVTTDTSSFDAGVTAASLSAVGGPWTVGGQSYSHRSAQLSASTGLTTGTTPSYTITATDAAGNVAGPVAFTATIETYSSAIAGTSGLVSYWRFGDGAISGDEFTDIAETPLSNHVGATGASWTLLASSARAGVITGAGRMRKTTGVGAAQYYTSDALASANYLVEGEIYVASLLATDVVAVVGRHDISGAGETYYVARYVRDTGRFELGKVVSGTRTLIGTGTGTGYYTQALGAASRTRMTLQMNGTSIALLVDGVSRITATDASIAAAGRGGLRVGEAASTAAVSDSAGLHLDDFRISSLTTAAADSRGTNNGVFTGGPRLNEPGALAGDANRAARLDGTDDYVTVPDANALDLADGPLTLEAWVKRSTVNTGRLSVFHKGTAAFQVGLLSDNVFLAKNAASIASSTTTVTGTGWHHVVVTKSGSASKIYINGTDRTGTVSDLTLANTTSALIFGARSGTSEFLAATIDEFAIYNTVLDAPTVVGHYNLGVGTG